MPHPVAALRAVALYEAISYLVLLGIAMPLKYWAAMPLAVSVVGTVHGVLFVWFCVALLRVLTMARWPLWRAVVVFVASLLPVVPFLLDRRMRDWAAEPQVRD